MALGHAYQKPRDCATPLARASRDHCALVVRVVVVVVRVVPDWSELDWVVVDWVVVPEAAAPAPAAPAPGTANPALKCLEVAEVVDLFEIVEVVDFVDSDEVAVGGRLEAAAAGQVVSDARGRQACRSATPRAEGRYRAAPRW